jgi:hypothetical protein
MGQVRQKFLLPRHSTQATGLSKAALGLPTHSRRNCRRPKFHTGSQLHVTPHHQLRFPDSTFNDNKMPVCSYIGCSGTRFQAFLRTTHSPFFPSSNRSCPWRSSPQQQYHPGHDHDANSTISPEPQVVPHQAEACQGAEAEPPCASMDQAPNRKHYPVCDSIIYRENPRCRALGLHGGNLRTRILLSAIFIKGQY